jgi:hypothetical protein
MTRRPNKSPEPTAVRRLSGLQAESSPRQRGMEIAKFDHDIWNVTF